MANKKTKEQRKASRAAGRAKLATNAKEIAKLSAQIAGEKAKGAAIDKITGTSIGSDAAQKATKHLKRARTQSVIGAVKGAAQAVFNHPQWYTHYDPKFVNVNLATRIGLPSPVVGGTVYNVANDGTSAFNEIRYPGTVACVNYFALTPKGDQEGFELGLNRIFTQMRAANSGAVNYTVEDIAQYIKDARDILTLKASIGRLIKTMNSYSLYDTTIPTNILLSMGLSLDKIAELQRDLASLTNYYNNFGLWIEANVVGKWDIFNRAQWLEGNVFRDSDDRKHQYILFMNKEFKAMYESGTLKEIVALISQSKQIFTSKPKNAIIAGDLIKQSTNNIHQHTLMDSTDALDIVYDEYILTQFQNTTLQSVVITQSNGEQSVLEPSFDVFENTATWSMNDQLRKLLVKANTGKLLFNSPTDSLEAGRILSLTRFMSVLDLGKADSDNVIPVHATEVATHITTVFNKTVTNDPDSTEVESIVHEIGGVNLLFTVSGDPGTSDPVNQFKQLARTLEAWSNIDFFPMIKWGYANFNTEDDSTTYGIMGSLFDINVFGYVDKDQLASYHNAADASLLYMESPVRAVSSSTSLKY